MMPRATRRPDENANGIVLKKKYYGGSFGIFVARYQA